MSQSILVIPQHSQILPKQHILATTNSKPQRQKQNIFHQKSTSIYISQQTQQISVNQYKKLQQLLQNREASLRQHIKHEHQLKLYIEELQEKNKSLKDNNSQVINQYRSEVTGLKKENQKLRMQVKNLEQINQELEKTLKFLSSSVNKSKSPLSKQKNNQQNEEISKSHNQSVIKVIQSQQLKRPNNRQISNSKNILIYSNTGHQSPLITSQQSNLIYNNKNNKSQSKQKIKVTMKNSSINNSEQKQKILTPGRYFNSNNNHLMNNQQSFTHLPNMDNIKNEENSRSIKRIMQLKKNLQQRNNQEQILASKKLFVQKQKQKNIVAGNNNNIKHHHQHHQHKRANSSGQNNSQRQKYDTIKLQEQMNIVKKLAKQKGGQLGEIFSRGVQSQKIELNFQTSSKKINNNHDLIKLGHNANHNIKTQRVHSQKLFQ